MTLRSRLTTLADNAAAMVLLHGGGDRGTFRDLAAEAARIALNKAVKICEDAAKVSIEVESFGNACGERDCADAIRLLRDQLGNDRSGR